MTTTATTLAVKGLAESASDLNEPAACAPRANLTDTVCRRLVLGRLQKLSAGGLKLSDGQGEFEFGSGRKLSVTVKDPRFYRQLVLGGSVGAADAYIDGRWTTDDLTGALRLFLRNRAVLKSFDKKLARVARAAGRIGHVLRRNTKVGSRRNIAAHYDLGNDFFELFLDPTMMYSAAVFERDEMTLEEASVAKLDRICRRLKLTDADHVVEIGTGWGGFAVHAATQYGCRITTTTISREQYEYARERVAAAGLEDRVTVLFEDYRDLTGQYDKLVSIEMVEAVGLEHLPTYFRKCSQLLKPDGAMLIQAITIADQLFATYRRGADFIQKYIFPGGALPSVSELHRVVGTASDMRMVHVEDIAAHYARTLVEWRKRFHAALDDVRCQGFPERFIRMWDYYLCYCEAGFEERTTGTVQLLLAKPGSRLESVRNDRVAQRVAGPDQSITKPEWEMV